MNYIESCGSIVMTGSRGLDSGDHSNSEIGIQILLLTILSIKYHTVQTKHGMAVARKGETLSHTFYVHCLRT